MIIAPIPQSSLLSQSPPPPPLRPPPSDVQRSGLVDENGVTSNGFEVEEFDPDQISTTMASPVTRRFLVIVLRLRHLRCSVAAKAAQSPPVAFRRSSEHSPGEGLKEDTELRSSSN